MNDDQQNAQQWAYQLELEEQQIIELKEKEHECTDYQQ